MMMTISHAINDVVLVVLKTPEILEPVGISQEKFFAKVLGYDGTGLWVQLPDFELPVRVGDEVVWVSPFGGIGVAKAVRTRLDGWESP